ncbi:MAG: hypothetical protein KAW19_07115 [Candidatus Aminicenantes bacterium]|nr:hypothetical protein [Candidatus Aminicenantes bacterium]
MLIEESGRPAGFIKIGIIIKARVLDCRSREGEVFIAFQVCGINRLMMGMPHKK